MYNRLGIDLFQVILWHQRFNHPEVIGSKFPRVPEHTSGFMFQILIITARLIYPHIHCCRCILGGEDGTTTTIPRIETLAVESGQRVFYVHITCCIPFYQ